MKFFNLILSTFVFITFLPGIGQARNDFFHEHVSTACDRQQISYQQQQASLTQTDKYGTPRVIELASEGKIDLLMEGAKYQSSGEFLLLEDSNGNGVFHVARNANTVQALAGLFRKFYKEKASQQMSIMINKRNKPGETPLMAQINNVHADTFWPIYNSSLLKQESETVKYQLASQQNMGAAIAAPNKAYYCKRIRQLASDKAGRTLWQMAQAQAPGHPEMAHLAHVISQEIPCMTQD